MKSSYKEEDVTLLLKDITGMVMPQPTEERERLIQSGRHYSEMLPQEYRPTDAYLKLYEMALEKYADITAQAVAAVSEKAYNAHDGKPVLVSLARAGTPIGILMRRYLQKHYGADIPHYSISIIRGRGIDKNAMRYLLAHHAAENLQFVDGWTGTGAIAHELMDAMQDFPGVSPSLAVLSDPANVAGLWGTQEDFLIASSCLNCTVSGLISRTFLRDDIIGPEDFHGAVCYNELAGFDRTYEFIDKVARYLPEQAPIDVGEGISLGQRTGLLEANEIAAHFGIKDINLVKPGIGEATRVLLRRLPERLLVWSLADNEHLGHLYQLAAEKNVPIEEYPLQNYRACGIIRTMGDA